jgi:hypothetical protein
VRRRPLRRSTSPRNSANIRPRLCTVKVECAMA